MIIFILIILLIIGFLRRYIWNVPKKSIEGKHVVISGGSSGIGKAVAILAAQLGAHVTIVARDVQKLTEAKEEILEHCVNRNQIVAAISVDLSDGRSDDFFKLFEDNSGPVYMYVSCAGTAICGNVESFTREQIDTLIKSNYLSALYPIQYLVPKMKACGEGIIVLVGSQVSLMGMYGYSVYSSCKFALRGLAESIAMELKPYNISVTLSLPPDTDTPGFAKENEGKPLETKLISESAGLMKPSEVAKQLMDDALQGNFFSYVGFESSILTTLCVGMSPFNTWLEVLPQFFTLGLLRVIGAFYIRSFQNIVQKCYVEKKEKPPKI